MEENKDKFTQEELKIVCEALTHLHATNVRYLYEKKDEYSQKQIPINIINILNVYEKAHKMRK